MKFKYQRTYNGPKRWMKDKGDMNHGIRDEIVQNLGKIVNLSLWICGLWISPNQEAKAAKALFAPSQEPLNAQAIWTW